MYQPPAFKETRKKVLLDAIAKHPLATLVCNTGEGLVANHLPMVADGDNTQLHSHLSRGNDLYQQCEEGTEVLAIFQGPTAYISADWYPGKKKSTAKKSPPIIMWWCMCAANCISSMKRAGNFTTSSLLPT